MTFARDLEVGDVIRTDDGDVTVTAIKTGWPDDMIVFTVTPFVTGHHGGDDDDVLILDPDHVVRVV